ncbi:phospho-sugar mutase [Actinotalea sp. M2MS4P-6]|uniref:phospho-sugar mutase n=1 Tax=Actinotalea sp. M2MS4P-6 TaxID=2983762 RepID=UPI0021E374E5|nr:phospho-sugar mutase [Actinotalea sp. M2MS4P-6]MCV2393506.1 phospho-sugar mutase [Actinotalea sp. M2MS4P-6]
MAAVLDAALADQVRAWIADDPDPATAAELQALLDRADAADAEAVEDLADRFAGTLEFGTAGLRGALGGGPNRMNRAVVIRAAAGLTRYLLDTLTEQLGGVLTGPGGDRPGPRVVIGFDARYGSHQFAQDTAAVVTAAGGSAYLMPRLLPTPVLAFAVRHLGADAGVMVTASHNPPQDNGYKVYLGGRVVTDAGQGAQIVPPYDAEIARRIAAIGAVADVSRATEGWTVLGEDVVDAYLDGVAGLRDSGPRDLRVVLTPLHGVGGALVEQVLRGAGFTDLHVVAEQAEPDPDFPTVSFPNPEEAGAIDLALALADRVDADLVIANDPDADRCAAAVRDPHTAAWRMLHGDEVGALLGSQAAARHEGGEGVLACSIVSSRLLARIAAAHGLDHRWTLTGFKWISRVDGLVFGYEEALGYCCDPPHVRDKDGLSAALLLAQLAAGVKAEGRTLVDLLDDLARRHGLHLTDQLSARFADLEQIPATMARVRSAPPASLAGSPVTEVTDLAQPDPASPVPPTDGLRLLAADGTRVVIRPSGTEPKVKCYLEVVVPVEQDAPQATVGQARRAARQRLDSVRADVAAALGLG